MNGKTALSCILLQVCQCPREPGLQLCDSMLFADALPCLLTVHREGCAGHPKPGQLRTLARPDSSGAVVSAGVCARGVVSIAHPDTSTMRKLAHATGFLIM